MYSFLHWLFSSCSCRFGFVRPAFFLCYSLLLSRKHSAVIDRRRGKGDDGHQHIAARVLPQQHRAECAPRGGLSPHYKCVRRLRQAPRTVASGTTAERLIASRRCLRRVFSRTRCLTSATRLAVSYISFEPPLRMCLKLWPKNPFTYIGTKNRKNSHPKRKIFQKNLRAAKKQLSRSGYSVIASAIIGKRTIFPPPPAAPAGRRPHTAPRRRRQSADYRWRGG